jgi:hypothetical protein
MCNFLLKIPGRSSSYRTSVPNLAHGDRHRQWLTISTNTNTNIQSEQLRGHYPKNDTNTPRPRISVPAMCDSRGLTTSTVMGCGTSTVPRLPSTG